MEKEIGIIRTGMDGIIYHVSKFLLSHIDEINSRVETEKCLFNISIGCYVIFLRATWSHADRSDSVRFVTQERRG